jgi:hypothetical protein
MEQPVEYREPERRIKNAFDISGWYKSKVRLRVGPVKAMEARAASRIDVSV